MGHVTTILHESCEVLLLLLLLLLLLVGGYSHSAMALQIPSGKVNERHVESEKGNSILHKDAINGLVM